MREHAVVIADRFPAGSGHRADQIGVDELLDSTVQAGIAE
jgi:hypothetical protein